MLKFRSFIKKSHVVKLAAVIPFIIYLLSSTAMCADNSVSDTVLEITLADTLADSLPETIPKQISQSLTDTQADADLLGSLKSVFHSALNALTYDFRTAAKQGVYLLIISVLCGLISEFTEKPKVMTLCPVSLCAVAAAAAPGIGQLSVSISLCETAVEQMCVFSKILFPSVAAACAASGSPSSGIFASAAALTVTGIVMSILKNLLFPAVYLYVTAVITDSIVENELIKKTAGFVKFAVTESMKWLIFLYLGYSGISTVISASADAAAVKTAKLAISGTIPIVGGIVSDSAGVILSGASLIKNSIGIAGMVSVAAICLCPFLRIGIYYLSYKISAAFCSIVAAKRISSLTDGIGTAFGMSAGIVGTVAILLFISISLSVIMVRPA